MIQDIRFALRVLFKTRGFTVVSILTLALGIGANTAMFSVLNTYLFRMLPYPNSERLIRVYRTSPHSQSWPHSQGNVFDYRDRNDVFEYLSAFTWISPTLSQPGEPADRVQGIAATADFFPSLDVQPLLGRWPSADEAESGANRVVVLSHRFWSSRFQNDPDIVGRTLRFNGENVTIIGVMPPGFDYPLLWGRVDIWTPLVFPPDQQRARGSNWLQAFGRLKPGVQMSDAQQAMTVLADNFVNEKLMTPGESLRLEPLQKSLSDEMSRNVMWFTFGLAGFVLLIACANLANLQLVRTAARTRELAVRTALGASRLRLVRQSLAESLAVSVIGGSLSLLVAWWGVDFISQKLFSQLPGARVSIDFKVFGFALLVSVATGLAFGVVPAWLSSRVDVNQGLRENSRSSTASRSHNRLRHSLIVGQVAFALVLLAGAGLFLRGIQRFAHLDCGWQVDGLVTARIRPQGTKYETDVQTRNFLLQLEQKLEGLPGVQKLAISRSQPVWGFNSSGPVIVEGQPAPDPSQLPEVFNEAVSPGYFDTLGIRVLEGRQFTAQDSADGPRVVIINETMARRFWPDESPIGKRIGREGDKPNWEEVVGVVNDISFPGDLGEPYTRLQSYHPLTQSPWGGWTIAIRGSNTAEGFAKDLRAGIGQLDQDLPVYQIRTARSLIEEGLGSISLLGTLLGAFAALGLVLAAIGIYGVTSYSVVQRTGEFGIRMALGAQRLDLLWLVLRKGSALVLSGAAIGALGAYAVGRLLLAIIPTLPTHDPAALAVSTAVFVFVALFACYVPARRATRVDPMVALRYE
jgi:predicted permease